MSYSIEPAFAVAPGLTRKLVLAGMDLENQWFFTDGSFTTNGIIEHEPNTWVNDNFVVIDDEDESIIGFFCATWSRPLDVISGFRLILFEKNKSRTFTKAFFEYLDYLFCKRGCMVFNWLVAEKNTHAYVVYEKFIQRYMGHRIGIKHRGQKSYSGEISDVILYEITKEEYFEWKNKKK